MKADLYFITMSAYLTSTELFSKKFTFFLIVFIFRQKLAKSDPHTSSRSVSKTDT